MLTDNSPLLPPNDSSLPMPTHDSLEPNDSPNNEHQGDAHQGDAHQGELFETEPPPWELAAQDDVALASIVFSLSLIHI